MSPDPSSGPPELRPTALFDCDALAFTDDELAFTDDELDLLLAPQGASARAAVAGSVAAPVLPSDELQAVADRIALQFVDVLAATSSRLFSRPGSGALALDPLVAAIGSLRTLAEAAGETARVALLDELAEHAATWREQGAASRGRSRFLDRMRAWLPAFADELGSGGGLRLRSVVDFSADEAPLLDELASMRGMGPRRLARLYCAGLHTVDALSGAEAEEVAQVTGLPRALSSQVREFAVRFERDRRRGTVLDLRRRLGEFERLLSRLDQQSDPDLAHIAREALDDLSRMVRMHADLGGEL